VAVVMRALVLDDVLDLAIDELLPHLLSIL
jgi:hypothetical protein